ncbi:polyprenyl synthetase family protein [Spirochaetota bacterium]
MGKENPIKSEVISFAKVINDYLKDNLLNGRRGNIWDAAYHYIGAGGKRIRPFIIYLCYQLIKGNSSGKEIIPVASAVELLHTFSLIHDDIIDDDYLRRGVKSVHAKWGKSYAILSGDLLFAMTNVLVNKSPFSDSIKNRILNEISTVCVDLSEGQAMDIEFEARHDISVDDYITMISLKTGALFQRCALIGGIAADASESSLQALSDYGLNIGISFQIIDDILDVFGEEHLLGKTACSDMINQKKTFLMLKAPEIMNENNRKKLEGIQAKKKLDKSDIESVIDLLAKSGVDEECRKISEEYAERACLALDNFPDSPIKDKLNGIAHIMLARRN